MFREYTKDLYELITSVDEFNINCNEISEVEVSCLHYKRERQLMNDVKVIKMLSDKYATNLIYWALLNDAGMQHAGRHRTNLYNYVDKYQMKLISNYLSKHV